MLSLSLILSLSLSPSRWQFSEVERRRHAIEASGRAFMLDLGRKAAVEPATIYRDVALDKLILATQIPLSPSLPTSLPG